MRRRTLSLPLVFLLAALPTTLCAQTASSASPHMTKKLTPAQVQQSAIVIDTHADTPQRFVDEGFDLSDPLKGGNFNLATARKGNL
ncbi:MAG TPA: membrane dipeptidase, partial [Terracidiphilus sp.]|nr:membrane dipeptidase [Terracidiphilus sp.]